MLVFREREHRKWVGGDNQEVRGEMSECDGEIMGASKCGSHFSTQRIWSWDNNSESHARPKQCKGQERNQWFRGDLCYLVSSTIHQEFYLSLGSSCISLSD